MMSEQVLQVAGGSPEAASRPEKPRSTARTPGWGGGLPDEGLQVPGEAESF